MGRLVDTVMASLGLRPSDRVVISHGPIATSSLPAPPDRGLPTPAREEGQAAGTAAEETLTTAPTMPTEEEVQDCFGCRLVGVGVGVAGSSFVLHSVYTKNRLYTGFKRVAFITQGALLTTFFITLGTYRYFEKSIFDPKKKEMTFKDHFVEELEMNRLLPRKEEAADR